MYTKNITNSQNTEKKSNGCKPIARSNTTYFSIRSE